MEGDLDLDLDLDLAGERSANGEGAPTPSFLCFSFSLSQLPLLPLPFLGLPPPPTTAASYLHPSPPSALTPDPLLDILPFKLPEFECEGERSLFSWSPCPCPKDCLVVLSNRTEEPIPMCVEEVRRSLSRRRGGGGGFGAGAGAGACAGA